MHYHHTFNFKVKCIFAKNVPPSYPVSSIVKSEKTSTSVFPDVKYKFSSVQLLSHVRLFATPWTATCQAFLPITNSLSLLKFMSSQSCHPTISSSVIPFSSCLPSFPASRSFQMSQSLHLWLKYWSFSFNISPPNEYSGLIFFTMGWFDLLAVQGTLKSLLQHHSSKASIIPHSVK